MPISLDLDKVAIKRQHGQFMALYHYVNDERAMILFPLYRKGIDGKPPAWAIVCDSAAWKYDDPRYLMQRAMEFCRLWDMTDKATVVKLATIIHEGLQDLQRLPPKPVERQDPNAPMLGEADILIGGQRVASHEIAMPTADDLMRFPEAPNGYQ